MQATIRSNMKIAVVFLTVLALGFSAPQPRKAFHEHVEEFLNIIQEEAGDKLEQLLEAYFQFEEFIVTFRYMQTAGFKELVYEMESLPEFKAVISFLENDNIDVLYFIDILNAALEQTRPRPRQQLSGRDLKSFITDSIAEFPKSKLSALFDQKMADDAEFRTAIENLQSDEWDKIWNALWENETFKAEAQIFSDNGVDLIVLLDEIMAIFGQN